MGKLFVLVLVCFTIISCNKNDTVEPSLNTEIIGQWEWIKSETIWPTYTLTSPKTVGYSHKLDFINGTFVNIIYSDTLQNICNYSIEDDLMAICDNSYSVKIKSDTLILSQAHIDGPISYYKKF